MPGVCLTGCIEKRGKRAEEDGGAESKKQKGADCHGENGAGLASWLEDGFTGVGRVDEDRDLLSGSVTIENGLNETTDV